MYTGVNERNPNVHFTGNWEKMRISKEFEREKEEAICALESKFIFRVANKSGKLGSQGKSGNSSRSGKVRESQGNPENFWN